MSTSGENKHKHHVVPFKVYIGVWIGLLVLTVITVAASYVDFGSLNMAIAMLIATVKALLVILFFMGLYYDGQENNVTFFVSFVFLIIFVTLTWFDESTRVHTTAAPVDASELASMSSEPPADLTKLLKPDAELLAKGGKIYDQNCATCHGPDGKGDGPAAAALNPKPRNFSQSDGWKNGREISAVFKTITNGIPGTPMPPFSGISAEDRMALVHYVRSKMVNPPAESSADVAALEKLNTPVKPRIPVKLAMELMGEENQVAHAAVLTRDMDKPSVVLKKSAGARLYSQHCLQCHGDKGQGGIKVSSIGVNPPLRFITKPLRGNVGSFGGFQDFVSHGLPGQGMPGFAQFSQREWQELYQYVRSL